MNIINCSFIYQSEFAEDLQEQLFFLISKIKSFLSKWNNNEKQSVINSIKLTMSQYKKFDEIMKKGFFYI